MKKTCAYLFLLLSTSSMSQNLVPNSSFEDTIKCPDFPLPNIGNTAYWSSYLETPDYFNSCANSSQILFGVPGNFAGFQNAYIGNAYAGLLTWGINAGSPIREYIGVQLIQSLTIGNKYYVSCFISNADSIYYNSSANMFGFRFSTVSYASVDNLSHIHSDSVVTNKANWTRISGSFIADSSYQYLILGNFYDDTQTIADTSFPTSFTTSYYYVDAVCVTTDSIYDSIWTSANEVIHSSQNELFPNPVNLELFINNSYSEELVMYDLLGQKIITRRLIKGLNKIDASVIAAGMYLIFLDGKYFNKLIVQH
jgi:type IX secretion system substrate protein